MDTLKYLDIEQSNSSDGKLVPFLRFVIACFETFRLRASSVWFRFSVSINAAKMRVNSITLFYTKSKLTLDNTLLVYYTQFE